jgi:hypothetical protein
MIVLVAAAGLWQANNSPVLASTLEQAIQLRALQPTPQVPIVKRQAPQRDGSIVHSVQQGDTLSTIAFAYGVDIDQIRKLNNLSPNSNNIIIGQKLLIRGSNQTTPTPTEDTSITMTPTPTLTATEIPVTPTLPPITNETSVCVKAFNDANRNHWDDTGEQPLTGVKIKLVEPTGGNAEAEVPTCFNDLPNGMFIISALPPSNFGLTTPPQLQVQIKAGQQITLMFGAAEGYQLVQAGPGAAEATLSKPTTAAATVPDLVAQNSGLIVLAVAGLLFVGGMSVAFLARRL